MARGGQFMTSTYTYPVDAILLLGPTGVGKSPLGDILARDGIFNRPSRHFDFGLELRLAVSDRDRSFEYTTAELDFIHGVLERGVLLENERFPLARKIIGLFLDRVRFSRETILILNGMPRHLGQAVDISFLAEVHAVVILECPVDAVVCRIRNNVGGDRAERLDDNEDLIKTKLTTFAQRTEPLINHYERLGRRIYRISVSGEMTPAEAYQHLSALASAHPPVAFVAEPPQ